MPPPVPDSVSPEPVAADSHQSDGLWKLTLDKQPPPGVNLVLFLPVCPTQTNVLSSALPSAAPPTLPVSAVQAHHQVAVSPVTGNGHCGVNAAVGVSMDTPLDLVTRIKKDPECEAPLDLSKNCNSSKTAVDDGHLPAVKSEPEEFEISGDGEHMKTDPLDLATCSTTDPRLTMDVKQE